MLFRRRNRPSLVERIRIWLWPRRSWRRSTRYIMNRVSRLGGSPHAIAVGAAVGCLVSFTPFLGLHFLLAGLGAWSVRGSIVASALGTFVGNPLTFPFIWLGSYKLGSKMLGYTPEVDHDGLVEHLSNLSSSFFHASWQAMWQILKELWPIILKPMTIGGVSLGLIAATVCYYVVRRMVYLYQVRRSENRDFFRS